jgi:NAD(P)-dependent dehydrogenase (short-subunit alcohol dehydrogenase family)
MTNMVVESAIVTGGAGGVGRPVAKRLARDGFCIAVNYSGNPDKAQQVATEIKSAGGKAISVKLMCPIKKMWNVSSEKQSQPLAVRKLSSIVLELCLFMVCFQFFRDSHLTNQIVCRLITLVDLLYLLAGTTRGNTNA